MRRCYVALTFVLLFWGSGRAQSLQTDSVGYLPATGYYLIYSRDSLGAWQLRELLTSEEYFRAKALQQTGEVFYEKGKPPLPKPLPQRPKLGLKANGYLSLNLSHTTTEEDNPLLPVGLRKRSHFTILPEMNIHLKANYSERLQLDLSYTTEPVMADRRSRVRLRYEGENYDFVQRLQAGNVRMESRNPLIDTGGELFGVRADLLMGPFSLQVVASRQYAEERKIVVQGGRQLIQTELKGSDYDFAQHFFLSEFFAAQYSDALKHLPLVESDLYIDRVEVWVTTPRQMDNRSRSEPITAFKGASTAQQLPSSNLFETSGIEITSARKLPPSAYTLHPTLGFISLQSRLGDGQILAVAYSYHYKGKRYQVGDLVTAEGGSRRVALLSEQDRSPHSPLWGLMMKNGYSLSGARPDIQNDELQVSLVFKDEEAGVDKPIVERGADSGRSWLDLFGWDRADSSGRGGTPDGLFDLIDGVTYLKATGTLFLPQRYPFMEIPRDGYPTFQALYTKSQREAKEAQELDLFRIQAEVTGSQTQSVSLGNQRIEPGSVRVEAGGRQLSEGVEYVIDYLSGRLTLTTNTTETIEITVKEREQQRRKEKSLVGAELNWTPSPRLNVGGTLLAYWEDSRRNRIRWGEEVLRNRMWGVHASYHWESPSVMEWFNEWSGLEVREPLKLSLQASYAELLSDYNRSRSGSDKIVVEDFEEGNRYIELTYPQGWSLGYLERPESRAQLAWFKVDALLVRDGAPHQPTHLMKDQSQRRHPLVREVPLEEFFPQRDRSPIGLQTLSTLNLSFYPSERGPYNPQSPTAPQEMWGSISYPLSTNDLENRRYSYMELWMLDPFTLDPDAPEGMLYLDLGRMKEEILPDQGIYYEGSETKQETEWGRKALTPPQLYGFDTTGKVPINQQDVGLDGLTSEEERSHPRYQLFRDEKDPAKDDYRFFLGDEWDEVEASILERYRYINGMEGNSTPRIIQGVESARTWDPDTEDLNRDMIQEQEEGYLRYELPITRQGLSGEQIVGEKRLSERERWVKLRIPLHAPSEQIGQRVSLQDVRTLRLSLTRFSKEAQLRLAQFRIVSTSWSKFQSSIEPSDMRSAEMQMSTLSLEEDSQRAPIPYLSPPEVDRDEVASDWAVRAEDEQALAMKIAYLAPGQPVAIYKEQSLDLRHYQQLELWSHLESEQMIARGELELFIRVGYDFTRNYYEYRLPLEATPIGNYSALGEELIRSEVWRPNNLVQISLADLTELKHQRQLAGGEDHIPFVQPDPAHRGAAMVVKGQPTLGEVTAVLIGVRNKSDRRLSAEVWVNEMAVKGARAVGGKAAQGAMQLQVGELASLHLDGQYRTAGFGSITSDSRKYELQDMQSFLLRTELELGMLLPKRWQLRFPIRYSLERQKSTPFYDPFDSDLRNEGGIGATFRQQEDLQLTDMRWLNSTDKRRPWSLSNWLFSYRLHRQKGYAPDLLEERERSSESEVTYQFDTSQGSYIRLNSLWNRYFRYQQFPSDYSALTTLRSRWDWVRGLQIKQSYKGLTLSLQSTTMALIHEPFEARHRESQASQFEWMTREILRDLTALGSTEHYFGQLELAYRLPQMSAHWLQPLTGQATWRSNYQWQLGARSAQYQQGNRAENGTYLDLLLQYHFSTLPIKVLQDLSLHLRRTTGTSLTGLLATGGKVMGLGFVNRQLMPGFAFRLGMDHPLSTFEKLQKQSLITQKGGSRQPLTSFWRNEMEARLRFEPLKGLELTFTYENNRHHHTSVTPYQTEGAKIERGNLRYSTVARLQKHPEVEHFAQQSSLLYLEREGLPSLLATLPNWQVSLNISQWHSWLKEHIPTLKLTHQYRAYVEVPTYYITAEQNDLQSLVVSEELSPLIGLEVKSQLGISLEERYNQRHSQTLQTTAKRILDQTDHELYSRLGYYVTFAPLFTSKISLLRSERQSLRLQLHHTYTYSLLRNIQQQESDLALQGMKAHTLQFSAEYGLSDAISVRAFVERQQRRPLVSNYSFPFKRTTYGLLFRLQLKP